MGVEDYSRGNVTGSVVPRMAESDIVYANETITPETAQDMLRTADFPDTDDKIVATYARLMARGAWAENGMPIVFDETGRLIDGKSRLAACVKADTPIKTLVARNVRADILHTIDQQRRRSYTGVLESRGYENAGLIVRTLSKLFRIENGALKRHVLPVSWPRYDRIMEANPEIADAVSISTTCAGNSIPPSVRPVLAFMAIRAGKTAKLRAFLKQTDRDFPGTEMNAATQARMRMSAWESDDSITIESNKVLGNAIAYFNAFCADETLKASFVWNPDRGQIRMRDGKWAPSDTVVRTTNIDGLGPRQVEIALGERDAADDELEAVARRLLRRRPVRRDEDGQQIGHADPFEKQRMKPADIDAFVSNRKTLAKRLAKAAETFVTTRPAPFNLGLPLVEEYPGLRMGRIQSSGSEDTDNSRMVEDLKSGIENTSGEVQTAQIVLTPELAERWLSKKVNSGNRKIQKNHIAGIARDIKNDNWMQNAQPICFSNNPFADDEDLDTRLLNGQHRLHGVLEADAPIEVTVAWNIAPEAFSTYDAHAKRNLSLGRKKVDDRVMSAAARLQWREDQDMPLTGRGQPTAAELVSTLDLHPDMGDHFARSRRANMTRIGSAGVLTYFFYRVHRDNPSLAAQFLDDLEYGSGLNTGNPVLKLREDVLINRTKMSRKDTLNRLLDGWNAYQSWSQRTGQKSFL